MLIYERFIGREMIQANPQNLFVFGDNYEQAGYGGQAKNMRGEPNAVGIFTKKAPSMEPDAFFTDADFEVWFEKSMDTIARLKRHRGVIVWPEAGIGTGLAQLPTRAPSIFAQIERWRDELA